VEQHAGQVEMPPPASANAIVAGTRPTALGAPPTSPRRCDIDHQANVVEADVKNTGLFQTQQVAE